MDVKQLEKLAKLCRKLGVKQLKTADIELVLGDEPNISRRQRSSKKTAPSGEQAPGIADVVEGDQLTEEQLLFYSVLDPSQSEIAS